MGNSSGKALLAQAEAKLGSSSRKHIVSTWLNSIFSSHRSGESSLEQAAELFGQAANCFKIDKQCLLGLDAGSAFMKMAACYSSLGEKDEQLSSLVLAASCFKKSETPIKAVEPLTTATSGFLDRGRLHTAAKHFRDLGDLFELLAGKPVESGLLATPATETYFKKAIEAFQKSSDLYLGEDAVAYLVTLIFSTSNACLVRVGMLSALSKTFDFAVKTFEEMARQSVSQVLARWSVKDHLFRSSLCMLASRDYDVTISSIERALYTDYIPMDSGFSSSLECTFIMDVIEAVKEDNLEEFNEKTAEFEKISPLDPWKLSLLKLIKERFDEIESLS